MLCTQYRVGTPSYQV